jgi:hypothetical protein
MVLPKKTSKRTLMAIIPQKRLFGWEEIEPVVLPSQTHKRKAGYENNATTQIAPLKKVLFPPRLFGKVTELTNWFEEALSGL